MATIPETKFILSGASFTGAEGEPATITYSFKDRFYEGSDLGPKEIEAVHGVLQTLSDIANITFTEVKAGEKYDLAFAQASNNEPSEPLYGLTSGSDKGIGKIFDAQVNIAKDSDLQPGGTEYLHLLQNMERVLGVTAPGEQIVFEDDGVKHESLPAELDKPEFTIMSHNEGDYKDIHPSAPMTLDIAALQQLYGANHNYHAGDDVYKFDGSKLLKTIWDGGGNDTFDTSQYKGNVTLDLREGPTHATHVGDSHIWNAFGANIENGTAGDGDDVIFGNALGNKLIGNAGNDTIYGHEGDDTIYGGRGKDFLYGDKGNDLLYGGKGNDTIHGGQGNDTIFGDEGDDVLWGDRGNDRLDGGLGRDTFCFGPNSGVDVIMDFNSSGKHEGDILQISKEIFATPQDALSHVSYHDGNAIVDLGHGNSVTLLGIESGELTVDDFQVF
ncbi:MAG: hypothetical protein K0R63_782 [Rickettsiales bacterium]|jgi:serralysin|nr:hypothetical protein [Rickettsiales bacterium]